MSSIHLDPVKKLATGMYFIFFTDRRETSTARKVIFYSTFFENRIVHTVFDGGTKSLNPFCAIDAHPFC